MKDNTLFILGALAVGGYFLYSSRNASAQSGSFNDQTGSPMWTGFIPQSFGSATNVSKAELSKTPTPTTTPSTYFYSATPTTQTTLSAGYAQKLVGAVQSVGATNIQEAIDKTAKNIKITSVTTSSTASTAGLSSAVLKALSTSTASSVKAGKPTAFDIRVAKSKAGVK